VDVGEVAATASRDPDLFADLIVVFQQENPLAAVRRREGAEHPGAAATDHDHIVVFRDVIVHWIVMTSKG
jgi:hypothetical protein